MVMPGVRVGIMAFSCVNVQLQDELAILVSKVLLSLYVSLDILAEATKPQLFRDCNPCGFAHPQARRKPVPAFSFGVNTSAILARAFILTSALRTTGAFLKTSLSPGTVYQTVSPKAGSWNGGPLPDSRIHPAVFVLVVETPIASIQSTMRSRVAGLARW